MDAEKHIHIHIHLDGLLGDEEAVRRVPTQRKRPAPRNGKPTAREVRLWAKDHGVPVSDTGKVGKDAIAAYEAAH